MKKRLSLLLSCALFSYILSETNPRTKDPYVRHIAKEVQSLCCHTLLTSTADRCTALRPITQPIAQGLVYLYTDTPKDYIFFTHYTTRFPRYTVYGIGIAGHFVRWNAHSGNEVACFL